MDWILTLLFIVKTRQRYDICITMSLHLVLLGILLRSIGVVKQAVSVVEAYNPSRYGLPLLRRLYRRITSWCLVHSDFVVQVSPFIDEVLIRDGIRVNPTKQVIIPQPVDSSEIGFLPLDQLEPDSVVYIGQMTAEYGFELVVEAIDLVARKRPAIIVTVTSYSKPPPHLLEMIRAKGLERHFRLLGFTRDEEFGNVVRKNRVGLAIYRPTATSKKYADVFRPWVYMANGVPTIITRVPPVAAEIEKAGAGVVIDYEREQLANAILSLLTDDQLHHRCRQNGLMLVRQRTTGPVLRELFVKLGIPADS
jgi:glycosyltransferase involved in cell wall biosynthesis